MNTREIREQNYARDWFRRQGYTTTVPTEVYAELETALKTAEELVSCEPYRDDKRIRELVRRLEKVNELFGVK